MPRHSNLFALVTDKAVLSLAGGWLWQQADSLGPDGITFTPVSETQPTQQQLADLAFAWRCVKHVKSNAITVAKEQRLLAWAAGSPTGSRVSRSPWRRPLRMCKYVVVTCAPSAAAAAAAAAAEAVIPAYTYCFWLLHVRNGCGFMVHGS